MGDKKASSNKLDRIYHFEHITENIHGLKGNFMINILHFGNKYPRTCPRVKIFRSNLYGDKTFTISLNTDPDKIELLDGTFSVLITKAQFEKLILFVKKYRIPLMNLWYDIDMSLCEMEEEMAAVDRGEEVALRKP